MTASDEELVKAFQNGNDFAYVNLYNRFKQAIYVFCLKMLHDSDGAKDIVQGIFLKIYERRHQLIRTEKFKAWIFTIARHDCLTYLQKANRSSGLPDEIEDVNLILPSNGMDRDEEASLVIKAIEKLKPDLREVIILREYENLSYKQIAEIIGTNDSIVKSRLFTARQQLYETLKPIYVEGK